MDPRSNLISCYCQPLTFAGARDFKTLVEYVQNTTGLVGKGPVEDEVTLETEEDEHEEDEHEGHEHEGHDHEEL